MGQRFERLLGGRSGGGARGVTLSGRLGGKGGRGGAGRVRGGAGGRGVGAGRVAAGGSRVGTGGRGGTGGGPLYARKRAGLLGRQKLRKSAGQAGAATRASRAATAPQYGVQERARQNTQAIARRDTVLDYQLRADADRLRLRDEESKRDDLRRWARLALDERNASGAGARAGARVGFDRTRLELDKRRFDAQYGPGGYAQQELTARAEDRAGRSAAAEGRQAWQAEGRAYDRTWGEEGRRYARDKDRKDRAWRERNKPVGAGVYRNQAEQGGYVFGEYEDELQMFDDIALKIARAKPEMSYKEVGLAAAKEMGLERSGAVTESDAEADAGGKSSSKKRSIDPGSVTPVPLPDPSEGRQGSVTPVPLPDPSETGPRVPQSRVPATKAKSRIDPRIKGRPRARLAADLEALKSYQRRPRTREQTGGGYEAWRKDREALAALKADPDNTELRRVLMERGLL